MTTETTATAGPLDRLRLMHSDGSLAARRHDLPALLDRLATGDDPAAALRTAGRLIGSVRDQLAGAGTETLTVSIDGSGTLDGLVPSLTAELARHRLLLSPLPGDHGAWERALLDADSPVYAPGTALALCVLDASVVFDSLPTPWTAKDATAEARDVLARLDHLTAHHARHGQGTLVLNTLPLLREHTHQLVDHRSRTELGAAWRELNAGILRLATTHPRTHTIDLEPLANASGPVRDTRLAGYARARLGAELLAGYAREVAHLARTLRGRTKKVLVLDADNTLWDGILGDAGPEGIAAASTLRGDAFGRFQRVIRQLGAQGVLLAVCSKNDQEPLAHVLRTHPDMALSEDDFTVVRGDWGPKDKGLRAIAERLGLGVDSLVFADDSPFERAQVAAALPDVAVVPLDDEPALHAERLLADGWFDVPELTDTDRQRGAQYRSEGERRELLESAESYEDFLARLEVAVDVAPLRPHEVARVAQLTQRTNQFNLTTRRMTADEVTAAAESGLVLTVSARDRFGDNGLVGAVFVSYEGDGWRIDNALLSCRVFGRRIEHALLGGVLAQAAREAGVAAVHGRFRPTAKNHRFADFYLSLGFEPYGPPQADGTAEYRHALRDLPAVPCHITLTVTGGRP
ncbi:HAD-IIIC family phosphatase [Streptomyces sp. NPDC050211]|uniref:HAD-IIIC family phosphatase n=1 Tax=Streptomyces sp. NPDC050211 TaxID=3154932 RepID=UPI0034392FFF